MANMFFVTMKAFVIIVYLLCCNLVYSDQMYKIWEPILDSEREHTVMLQRVQEASNTCSVCSSNDGYLTKIHNFPHMAILHSYVKFTFGDIVDDCDSKDEELTKGLCMAKKVEKEESTQEKSSVEEIEIYAKEIARTGLVPLKTDDYEIDKRLATAIVTMNLRDTDEAIDILNDLIRDWPELPAALYCRAAAFLRKYKQDTSKLQSALTDINKVIGHEGSSMLAFERRAEIYMLLGEYGPAVDDVTTVLSRRPSHRLYMLRGILYLAQDKYTLAEQDFIRLVRDTKQSQWSIDAYHHLGLTFYYRGKLRNAIEVFKDVLRYQLDHVGASLALSQTFRELGNVGAARSKFLQTLSLNTSHPQTIQFQGDMFYYTGDITQALDNYRRCGEDGSKSYCQYMEAVCQATLGSFYDAVKSTTKMLVRQPRNSQHMTVSPDYLKALYLREQSRYLHQHLDQRLHALDMDRHYDNNFKQTWVRMVSPPRDYNEQPSIQPNIPSLTMPPSLNLSPQAQSLVCRALKVGASMQTNTDGYTLNRRLNFVMGLAAIHIAQYLETTWKSFRQNKAPDRALTWVDVFQIAVLYQRLVHPEEPVFWVDRLPDHFTTIGHRMDISFIRGSAVNVKVMQYFHLVFRLMRSMLEHYSSDREDFTALDEETDETKMCHNLLQIVRRKNPQQNALLVSTQVPSVRTAGDRRLEGVMVTLSQDPKKRVLFYINIGSTEERTEGYHKELRHTFGQIQNDLKKSCCNKVLDMDVMVNRILTLVYYFYNLMPLTRGSSVVAYTVALGLLMSFDRESTGKLPPGKLLEFEAILSGSPDSFILVTKQWMAIKKAHSSVHSLPKVWETFPTVRNLLELFHTIPAVC